MIFPRDARSKYSTTSLGSGKTTQRKYRYSRTGLVSDLKAWVVPQFILDSLITNGQGSSASILVTQPRRLSAVAVAARVSDERLSDGSVGYAIRGESKTTNKTKLLFCTTGVVLRRLSSGDKLDSVTHVVVDEVGPGNSLAFLRFSFFPLGSREVNGQRFFAPRIERSLAQDKTPESCPDVRHDQPGDLCEIL